MAEYSKSQNFGGLPEDPPGPDPASQDGQTTFFNPQDLVKSWLDSDDAQSGAKVATSTIQNTRTPRPPRIGISLPVLIGYNPGEEQTQTVFAMAHGAVITLVGAVRVGQTLTLKNLKNGKAVDCSVISVEPGLKQSKMVEVEFSGPMPEFWPVQFPAGESGHAASRAVPQPQDQPGRPAEPSVAPFSPGIPTVKADPVNFFPKGPQIPVPPEESHYSAGKVTLEPLAGSLTPDKPVESIRPPLEHKPAAVSTAAPDSRKAAASQLCSYPQARRVAPPTPTHRPVPRTHVRDQSGRRWPFVFVSIAVLALLLIGARTLLLRMKSEVPANSPSAEGATSGTETPTQNGPVHIVIEMQNQHQSSASEEAQEPLLGSNGKKHSPPAGSRKHSSKEKPESATTPDESTAAPESNSQTPTEEAAPAPAINTASTPSSNTQPAETAKNIIASNLPKPGPTVSSTPKLAATPSAAPKPISTAPIIPARLISSPPPEYPLFAKQYRIQGNVVLAVAIDDKGNVVRTSVLSGHQYLRAAAESAVRRWKYQPATLNGKAVPYEVHVNVHFSLN